MKIVAIHQPNFFPWLGYFRKFAQCGVFVWLDQVQFPKTGGNWINRVKILAGGETWFTVPVKRNFHGTRKISEIEINEAIPWRDRFIKTLSSQYAHAPFFRQTLSVLEPLIRFPSSNLSEFNQNALVSLIKCMRFDTSKLILGSTLDVKGSGTDLLISITQAVGGTHYLSGDGAEGYQEPIKFSANNIELQFLNFNHPTYDQCGTKTFVKGLSIIDGLMNCGFEKMAKMLSEVSPKI